MPTTLAERFEAMTCPEPNTGCLLWTGSLDDHGYGRIKIDGRPVHAQRVAFLLKHGRWPVPCGLHTCDTPACANGDHVFEGSRPENSQDMKRKGRSRCQKITHCPKGHPYDDTNTHIERTTGRRRCIICRREHGRLDWRRRRDNAHSAT